MCPDCLEKKLAFSLLKTIQLYNYRHSSVRFELSWGRHKQKKIPTLENWTHFPEKISKKFLKIGYENRSHV